MVGTECPQLHRYGVSLGDGRLGGINAVGRRYLVASGDCRWGIRSLEATRGVRGHRRQGVDPIVARQLHLNIDGAVRREPAPGDEHGLP